MRRRAHRYAAVIGRSCSLLLRHQDTMVPGRRAKVLLQVFVIQLKRRRVMYIISHLHAGGSGRNDQKQICPDQSRLQRSCFAISQLNECPNVSSLKKKERKEKKTFQAVGPSLNPPLRRTDIFISPPPRAVPTCGVCDSLNSHWWCSVCQLRRWLEI